MNVKPRLAPMVEASKKSWSAMLDRCRNPRYKSWHRYGGRGITVCERWQEFGNFLADMGTKPSRDHQIDRIDNDGNRAKKRAEIERMGEG